jgi:hypothetical protein
MPMTRFLNVASVAALLSSVTGHAQEPAPTPTFSTESQLVVLHVAVRDRKGV